MRHVNVPTFPEPLSAAGTWAATGEVITASAGALTDHFAPPTGEEGRANSATLLTGAPEGDFVFSARVHVDAQADFDAGTLFIYFDGSHWAKLCCEAMPGL